MPSLSYSEARKAALTGSAVRCGYMSKGWTIQRIRVGRHFELFCINPHTGSNYAFHPQARDREGPWEIVSRA